MNLSRQFTTAMLAVVVSLSLAACGGGGGGGDDPPPPPPPPPQTLTGVFLDSAVQGLTYETATQSGTTNTRGEFSYRSGEEVTFSVGSFLLGTAVATDEMTPVDLVPGAQGATEQTRVQGVLNIARFLQTLDEDGNADNGIVISATARQEAALLPQVFDLQSQDLDQAPEVQNLFSSLNGDPGLISEEAAADHLADTLEGIGSPSYAIGGELVGLASNQRVTVSLNNGDRLILSENGGFVFSFANFLEGATYQVGVVEQPSGAECVVASGSGTVGMQDVTSVRIQCSELDGSAFAIGGSVSGLSGSLLLLLNGGESLEVDANGPFEFSSVLPDGAEYLVSVRTQPPGEFCELVNQRGTVAGSPALGLRVICSPEETGSFTLGGLISGLSGALTLADAGEQITLSGDGPFEFPGRRSSGTPYSVSIISQPQRQRCSVSNGRGSIGDASVTDIAVTCEALPSFLVEVAVAGLAAGESLGLVLNSGLDLLTFSQDGTAAFDARLLSGTPYIVSVVTQPAGQTCSFEQPATASGTIASEAVGPLEIVCSDNVGDQFQISVTSVGLVGSLTLERASGGVADTVTLVGEQTQSFPTGLQSGADFVISVVSIPAGERCSFADGAFGDSFESTVADSDLEVSVVCEAKPTFSVGVRVNGFETETADLLEVTGPGNEILSFPSDVNGTGLLTFAEGIREGEPLVLNLSDPSQHACALSSPLPSTLVADVVIDVSCSVDSRIAVVGGSVSGLIAGVPSRYS